MSKLISVSDKVVIPPKENKKGIANHKRIAAHYQAAADCHLQAAKQHKNGQHKVAAESTIAAYGHASLANKGQRQDVRHHIKNG